ncbi:MAG: cation transporter, partial [Eubacterium sp.]
MTFSYTLQNLNCAHCAGKIEEKIAQTEGFENVSFNFATKKLIFNSDKADPVSEIQAICDSIEDGVLVVGNTEKTGKEDKEKEEKSKLSLVLLIIAIVLGVCALAIGMLVPEGAAWRYWTQLALCLAAIIISGYETIIDGLKSIIKLRFDETALMTIAVIAAFCLGEFVEAAMVTLLFSIGEFIEDKAVNASRRDIEKLAQIRPDFATVIADGAEKTVPAENVAVGSVIVIKPYERVPLDGVIISGRTTLDTSALTGESLPV